MTMTNRTVATGRYTEQRDVSAMLAQMDAYLMDHNGMSKRPMNLAMFLFALEHVARICRILRQPGAHALLVGVGGSGRQSLARLAAFVNGMNVFQVRFCPPLQLPLPHLQTTATLAHGPGVPHDGLISDVCPQTVHSLSGTRLGPLEPSCAGIHLLSIHSFQCSFFVPATMLPGPESRGGLPTLISLHWLGGYRWRFPRTTTAQNGGRT